MKPLLLLSLFILSAPSARADDGALAGLSDILFGQPAAAETGSGSQAPKKEETAGDIAGLNDELPADR